MDQRIQYRSEPIGRQAMSATIEHLWRTYTSLDLALLGSLLVGWLTLVAWCAVILDG